MFLKINSMIISASCDYDIYKKIKVNYSINENCIRKVFETRLKLLTEDDRNHLSCNQVVYKKGFYIVEKDLSDFKNFKGEVINALGVYGIYDCGVAYLYSGTKEYDTLMKMLRNPYSEDSKSSPIEW